KPLPGYFVPASQLPILNGAAGCPAVTQQHNVPIAAGTRALPQSFLQGALQIRSAAQPAGAHKIKRALNSRAVRRNGRSLEALRLAVEEHQIEFVVGFKRSQQRFQRLVATL